MKTRDLARWMREEHEKVSDLVHLVRKHIAVPPRSDRSQWVLEARSCFRRLGEHLSKHMALEERDGYMQFVLERRPTLAPQVEKLKHEHEELARIMDGVHKAVADLMPDDKLRVRDCCDRIRNLLSYVEHHENAENMLVTFVFTYDMGANH